MFGGYLELQIAFFDDAVNGSAVNFSNEIITVPKGLVVIKALRFEATLAYRELTRKCQMLSHLQHMLKVAFLSIEIGCLNSQSLF
jgi:hypothetical protein